MRTAPCDEEPSLAPISTITVPDAALSVELSQPSFTPGEVIQGRIRITNLSLTRRLHLDIGRRVAMTLFPDGTRAGGFSGAIAGLEATVDLAPGSESTVGFVGGSVAIDHAYGTSSPSSRYLAPGRYLLVVPLQIYGERRSDVLVTPPVDLILAI